MRLIDADKLESGEVIIPTENGGYEYVEVFYKDDVDNAPPVDAVEVVRCKDCWYSTVIPEEMQHVGEWLCDYWDAEMHEDEYCSCGKRRENENL